MDNTGVADFYLALTSIQKFYHKSLVNRLTTYDVSPGYLSVLNVLWNKDGLTQKELNSFIDVEQATLSNTLNRMVRDGLIQRRPYPKDKRRIHLYLTDKAISLKGTVTSAVQDLQSVVNKGLTVNDLRYFRRIMKQMTEQLRDDQADSLLVLFDAIEDET